MADLLGKDIANNLKEKILKELEEFKASEKFMDRVPCLGIVRVGENPDDIYYENAAFKKITSMGMDVEKYLFPKDIENEEFLKELKKINDDIRIDGILMFAPLPKTIDERAAIELISPRKDIDGLTSVNQAKVYSGDSNGFAPCTAASVLEILKSMGSDLTGKNVAVVGRSMVIGKPAAMLLLSENATVTMCHSRTKDLRSVCRSADIIIAAVGKAKMINEEYVSDGAIVIDVGINQDEDGKMCGDVDYDKVAGIASFITPVPGGVGSVTTSILAEHLLKAAKLR